MEIGVKITLNNKKMWSFLDRFLHIVLPDLIYFRKFNGWSYDQSGNLALGLKNLDVFPEMEWLKELQYIITQLGFLTGIDLVISWRKSSFLLSTQPIKDWTVCNSTNIQLFV
jgi:ribosomal protein L5